MLRHWSLCAISERSSCFMYKRTLSLYTPNTVESNDTCIGLRKSSRIINVIWYRGSSSGFGLSTGFASPLALSLSYTVNKHKSMTINTLFVTNLFNNNKHNKRKYMFWKRLYNMCQPNKEDVKGLPHYLNLLSGYKDASISISNFLNTHLHQIIAQKDMVHSCRPLINFSKGNQGGGLSSTYDPCLFDVAMYGSNPERSTQLPFLLTQALEGATLGSIRGTSHRYCIWLKDNSSCLVTFQWLTAPAHPWYYVSAPP